MKPKALPVLFQNIPLGLRSVPRWTLWNYVLIGEGETQRWSKLPVQPSGKAASSTNPDTWTDFLSVEKAYANRFVRWHWLCVYGGRSHYRCGLRRLL